MMNELDRWEGLQIQLEGKGMWIPECVGREEKRVKRDPKLSEWYNRVLEVYSRYSRCLQRAYEALERIQRAMG